MKRQGMTKEQKAKQLRALKKMLKPLVKQCIKECLEESITEAVLHQKGMMNFIIKEVSANVAQSGMVIQSQPQQAYQPTAHALPPQQFVQEQAQPAFGGMSAQDQARFDALKRAKRAEMMQSRNILAEQFQNDFGVDLTAGINDQEMQQFEAKREAVTESRAPSAPLSREDQARQNTLDSLGINYDDPGVDLGTINFIMAGGLD